MGLCQTGPAVTLHCGTTADMVRTITYHIIIKGVIDIDTGSFTQWPSSSASPPASPFPPLQDGLPNSHLLRAGRHLALLVSPRSPLGTPLQKHPQNPPPILRPLWHGG